MKIDFTVNGKPHTVDVAPDTPLLWVLREHLELTGTKFGCGRALCGACTVHVDGQAVRSCAYPIEYAQASQVQTIEGLESDRIGEAVVNAWIDLDVVQCGWCQPGQCMSAAALLKANQSPDREAVDASMSGNLCRCGTYSRIRQAVDLAAKNLREGAE